MMPSLETILFRATVVGQQAYFENKIIRLELVFVAKTTIYLPETERENINCLEELGRVLQVIKMVRRW